MTMAGSVLKRIVDSRQLLRGGAISRFSSLWTPDYLETMKPKIPQYPVVNVRIRGYSFPVLENYQKLVSIMATNMDLDIDNSYAIPARNLKVIKYKPRSSVPETEYLLNYYERNIQISNLSSPKFPVLVRMLEAALPEGVRLDIEEWQPEKEELRYVPDKQLLDLKAELEVMKKEREKK